MRTLLSVAARRLLLLLSLYLLGSRADVDKCLNALARLQTAPSNASLPFMNGVSGHINVAYLYQKGPFAILPNEAMGNYDLCNQAYMYLDFMVPTHYCMLGTDAAAGVCVPQDCTAQDLMSKELMMPLMNLGISTIQKVPIPCFIDPYMKQDCAWAKQAYEYYTNLYNLAIVFAHDTPVSKGFATCAIKPPGADGWSYLFMAVCCLLVALVLGTALYAYVRNTLMESRAAKKQEEVEGVTVVDKGAIGHPDETKQEMAIEVPESTRREPPSLPLLPTWLSAFSLADNWNEIFTLKTRGGEFAVFDGLKAISAGWVVWYHTILWMTFFFDNPESVVPPWGVLGQWWAMPFFNYQGTLSVDTFFFISGFLAAYMLLIKLDKEDSKGLSKPMWRWYPKLIMHRWLRITPAYAFCFFLHYKIAPLLAYGPIAKGTWVLNNRPCDKTWWAHFLYINDLYPWWNQKRGHVCYGHSWYLANDMQFYLLVPLFVVLFRSARKPIRSIGIALPGLCLLTCMIASGLLATQNKWSPDVWDSAAFIRYMDEGFARPWIRCSSYMIGILFAFLWYHKKTHHADFKFSFYKANAIWAVGLALLALAMYGPWHGTDGVLSCTTPLPGHKCGSDWSQATRSAIISLLRPTWTLGLALLCLLCWNNQGGAIQQMLAAPMWWSLSCLSFSVYLVHYTVLTFWIGQRTMRLRFDFFNFCVYFFGIVAISHGLATVAMMLVEKPFMKLQRMLELRTAPVVVKK